MQDMKQIKQDLGEFSEDPDKYKERLQPLAQIFNPSWKT
jgi:hypothetical protein